MIILKIFSKKTGNWKNLTDLFGFDPDPKIKYKNKSNRNFVGRWGRNGEKQPVKGKKRDRSKEMNSFPTTITTRPQPPKKKWWESIKKPTSKQIKNAALVTAATTGTAVGGKYLYDKYRDREQLKFIEDYRKRFNEL